jgi:hypothetical protein
MHRITTSLLLVGVLAAVPALAAPRQAPAPSLLSMVLHALGLDGGGAADPDGETATQDGTGSLDPNGKTRKTLDCWAGIDPTGRRNR